MVDGEAGEAGEAGGYSWENPEHSSAENDDTSGKIYQRLNLVAGSLSFYLEFLFGGQDSGAVVVVVVMRERRSACLRILRVKVQTRTRLLRQDSIEDDACCS